MTPIQKAWKALLDGGTIALARPGFYSVRDQEVNPIFRLGSRSFYHVKKLCRQDKKRKVWVIDKKAVRALSGNHWAKKYYQTKFPIKYKSVPLENMPGHATFTGKPSKKLLAAVNRLAQIAYNKKLKS